MGLLVLPEVLRRWHIWHRDPHSVDDMLDFHLGEGELVVTILRKQRSQSGTDQESQVRSQSQMAGEQRRLPDGSSLFTDHTRYAARNAGAGARGRLDIKQG